MTIDFALPIDILRNLVRNCDGSTPKSRNKLISFYFCLTKSRREPLVGFVERGIEAGLLVES